MQDPDAIEDVEKALQRLIPAAISQAASTEMELMLDELAGQTTGSNKSRIRWTVGVGTAAAVALAAFLIPKHTERSSGQTSADQDLIEEEPLVAMASLAEADRVENIRDEGLFIDAGGSAVRQVRIRVIEESSIRDEETGIIVKLTEPREELHLLPVSTF